MAKIERLLKGQEPPQDASHAEIQRMGEGQFTVYGTLVDRPDVIEKLGPYATWAEAAEAATRWAEQRGVERIVSLLDE